MEMLQKSEKFCPAMAEPKLVTITGTAARYCVTGKNELKCNYLSNYTSPVILR